MLLHVQGYLAQQGPLLGGLGDDAHSACSTGIFGGKGGLSPGALGTLPA